MQPPSITSYERKHEISIHAVTQCGEDRDDKKESKCPIFDYLFECSGEKAIKKMTNFDATEFNAN